MRFLIVAIAAVVFGVIVTTIWVGATSFERTVVSNPYEAGIHHDRDRRRAEALGWSFTVDEGGLRAGAEARLAVALAGNGGAPLDGAAVTARVSRPGTSRFDRSAEARPEGGGRYVAVLPMPEPGFWDLDLVVKKEGETLTLERWIRVGGGVGEGPHCDVGVTACRAEAGGVQFMLEVAPRPPRPLADLQATVALHRGIATVNDARVEIELSMPDMYMGENRIPLRRDGDGHYAGKGPLLRCASGRSDWVAEVVARFPGGEVARARFPFHAAE